jgi:hemoglobin
MYARIGGTPTIREAVDRFYKAVLDDEDLRPYFAGTNLTELKRHQVLLLSQVLGGPADYDGRALGEAHAGLGITDDHFDKVAGLLVAVLTDMGSDDEVIGAVTTTVGGLKPDIVERTGDGTAGDTAGP